MSLTWCSFSSSQIAKNYLDDNKTPSHASVRLWIVIDTPPPPLQPTTLIKHPPIGALYQTSVCNTIVLLDENAFSCKLLSFRYRLIGSGLDVFCWTRATLLWLNIWNVSIIHNYTNSNAVLAEEIYSSPQRSFCVCSKPMREDITM